MNEADKRAAEEYKRKLQDRALEMYEKKLKRNVDKNHTKLEKVRKYLKEMDDDNR